MRKRNLSKYNTLQDHACAECGFIYKFVYHIGSYRNKSSLEIVDQYLCADCANYVLDVRNSYKQSFLSNAFATERPMYEPWETQLTVLYNKVSAIEEIDAVEIIEIQEAGNGK